MRSRSLSAVLGGGLVLAFLITPSAAAAQPCYVAFVHGAGSNFTWPGETVGWPDDMIESYWTPDGSAYNSFTYYASRQHFGPGGSCAAWRVGYDGYAAWWDQGAAHRVAESLNAFIDAYRIPDGQLVIVGHSMGGIVSRWILNNGVPNAPYYNYWGADYARIVQKTKYLVSVQSPHAGAQAADAVFGEADHWYTGSFASVASLLGVLGEPQDSHYTLRRGYMEWAGGQGGWMGDRGRTTQIYMIAGESVGSSAGAGMDKDNDCDRAWAGLCYYASAWNQWGVLCGVSPWSFKATKGDGLVELESARGRFLRSNADTGALTYIEGRRSHWLTVRHNHNQGRYDMLYARVRDHLQGGAVFNDYPGSYIGARGLTLP